MLMIRLRRMGTRNRPFYRIVVSDSKKVPTASAIDEVGFYNPRVDPVEIQVDTERVDHWVGHGARMTPTVARLVRQSRKGAPAPEEAAPVTEAEAEAEVEAGAEVEAEAEEKAEAAVEPEAEPEAPAESEPKTENA